MMAGDFIDLFAGQRPTSSFTPGSSLPPEWAQFYKTAIDRVNQDPGGMGNWYDEHNQPYYDPVTGYLTVPDPSDPHSGRFRVIPDASAYLGPMEQKGAAFNGKPAYWYDDKGNFLRQSVEANWGEGHMDPLVGALGIMALPFAASALGIGSAAGAAAGTGATTAPVLGSTGALTGTELGTLGAGAAETAAGTAGATGFGEALASLPGHELTHFAGEIGGLGGASAAGLFGGGMAGLPGWVGPAASIAGGLLGSQGSSNSATTSTALDPRLDSAVFGSGGLVPTAQGLLGQQVPVGQAAQAQLMQVGSGLLGQTAPNTPTNPYVAGVLDDLQRRNQQMLDTSFNGIRDNAVGAGGLGGTRQGVAQGVATARAADNFTGQAANFMGNLYNSDQNRLLQQQTLGAGLLAQGQQAPWAPLNNAAQVYGQFRPQTTTVTSNQGGGAMGALGGALGAAQFGKSMGWWGA